MSKKRRRRIFLNSVRRLGLLVKWLGLLVMPTLILAVWKNKQARRTDKQSEQAINPEQIDISDGKRVWHSLVKLSSRLDPHGSDSSTQYDRIISILLAIFEADENRAYAVASKARGVLQTVGFVFAGNITALTLALRDGVVYATLTFVLIVVSACYLFCTIVAYFRVDHPRPLQVLEPHDAFDTERFGWRLLLAIKKNRDLSIYRTNFTVSAIRDVVRALVTAVVAVIVAIPTM